MSQAEAAVRARAHIGAPLSGADLNGWSALSLLGHVTSRGTPWLFVTARSCAWLGLGPLADARFVRVRGGYDGHWPFRDGALGGVVIDGDALADELGSNAAMRRVLAEASRANARQGNVLVVCGHRIVPRKLNAWREYGRPAAARWRRAARLLGQQTPNPGFAVFDGPRLTDVTIASDSRAEQARQRSRADRLVLRIAPSGRDDAGIIRAMVADASRAIGASLRVEHVSVRKIGKTAVFLHAADGRRYIMRIARSPIARARAERNYVALARLHSPATPGDIQRLVPSPVVRGSHAGLQYFVEAWLEGAPGPPVRGRRGHRWESQVVETITALHQATAVGTTLDAGEMTRLVHEPLAVIARACATGGHEGTLQRIEDVCDASLAGRVLPLVQTHGDFTATNCLFDTNGDISAVVDWEVSMPQGLPLLDLLQLLPIAGETSSHPCWQRFDYWLEWWRNPARLLEDPLVNTYVERLGVAREAIPVLLLVQWAAHVSERVDARRDDARWMRMRVWQPLESLGLCL